MNHTGTAKFKVRCSPQTKKRNTLNHSIGYTKRLFRIISVACIETMLTLRKRRSMLLATSLTIFTVLIGALFHCPLIVVATNDEINNEQISFDGSAIERFVNEIKQSSVETAQGDSLQPNTHEATTLVETTSQDSPEKHSDAIQQRKPSTVSDGDMSSMPSESPTQDGDSSLPTHYPTLEPSASTILASFTSSHVPSLFPSQESSFEVTARVIAVPVIKISYVEAQKTQSSDSLHPLIEEASLEPSSSPLASNQPPYLPSEGEATRPRDFVKPDSQIPSVEYTESPTMVTKSPSNVPTEKPSESPSATPTSSPSLTSSAPSGSSRTVPTYRPSSVPSFIPTMLMSPLGASTALQSIEPSSSRLPSMSPSLFTTTSVQPTMSPSTSPSIRPSHSPSALPTTSSIPSLLPSYLPSLIPSTSPSKSSLPSESPSTLPSSFPTIEPSDSPSQEPSLFPSQSPTEFFGETMFYVIADTPYSPEDHLGMPDLIATISDDATFAIHLGDILNSTTEPCNNETLQRFAKYLEASPIPFFIVPGDNEFTDCPNPIEALDLWRQNFVRFDQQHWNHTLNVITMEDRPESFSFIHRGTLFIGLNIVGLPRRNKTEWKNRLSSQADWTIDLIEQHRDGDDAIGNIVIMAHAELRSHDHRHFIDPLVDFIDDDLDNEIPIMYLQGDVHSWKYEEDYKDQSSFVRVRKNYGVRDPAAKIITYPTREGVEQSRELDGGEFYDVIRFPNMD
jgi:hypothetical protein